MLIRQSKNSFIRTTQRYGYIVNQLTRYDRTYDEFGADLLRCISREPQNIDDVIMNLLKIYNGVTLEQLKADFMDFANSLAKDKFIVMAETIEDLNKKDDDFTYAIDNPKTLVDNFYQATEQKVDISTQDFFYEEVQGRPLISTLQFELSSRCNERCIHCYIPNDKKNHGFDMPLEKVKAIIDEFAEMGGISVTLSGGEAFLHKDLMTIVQYCRKKDLKISILSNLISLKDEHIAILKEANVSLVQVSLYSMDPAIHDYITTVAGSWKRTKDSIEKLVANDIPVQISCPLMKANKVGYDKVLEYAKSLKVKSQADYLIMARSDLDTSNLANRLSIEETADVLRNIIKNDIDYRERTLTKVPPSEEMVLDFEKFKQQPVCSVGYDNCCITANGDVYPCAGWQDYILGNIYKQSLREIWENSEKVKALRKITQASFQKCFECEARDYCSKCLVRNYNESGGDMFAISHHFCEVAHLTKKLVEEEFGPELERRERLLVERLKNSDS